MVATRRFLTSNYTIMFLRSVGSPPQTPLAADLVTGLGGHFLPDRGRQDKKREESKENEATEGRRGRIGPKRK